MKLTIFIISLATALFFIACSLPTAPAPTSAPAAQPTSRSANSGASNQGQAGKPIDPVVIQGIEIKCTRTEPPRQKQVKSTPTATPRPTLKVAAEQVTSSQVAGRISHLSDIYAAPGASQRITVTFQNTSNVTTHYRLENSGSRGGWEIRKECRSVVEGDCEAKDVRPGNTGTFDYSVRAPMSGSSTATWILKATHSCDSFRCQTVDVDRQLIQLSVR